MNSSWDSALITGHRHVPLHKVWYRRVADSLESSGRLSHNQCRPQLDRRDYGENHWAAPMSKSNPSAEKESPGFYTPVGSRRTFFRWVTRAAAGLIGLGLAIPLVGYVISPALKRRKRPWVDVGAIADLPLGEPKQLDHVTTIRDGWMETKSHKAIWAIKQMDGQVIVFSPLCTHLGCGYRWDVPEQKFKCPCHGSVFDVSGKVLGGPAPRSLDVLPTRMENGRLFVIYKEFKSGLSRPVEL